MGSFGAIAEFHQDRAEVAVVDQLLMLMLATKRGSIHIHLTQVPKLRIIAYETVSAKRRRWGQALSLCLPEAFAERPTRTVLTELGPDDDAVRGIDRTGILFDMGLSLRQCDFCIRTSDPKLLSILRANLDRSLFDPANAALGAILATHPHRVALTNVGRVEVYQKIGGPDTGGVSPPGPHTHLLPKLLKTGRTHSANTPIPKGMVPIASLHPGNPIVGAMGEDLPFDSELHHAFQELLRMYGDPAMVVLKENILLALRRGESPETFEMQQDRFSRATLRVTLRQQACVAAECGDQKLGAIVEKWRGTYDHTAAPHDEDDGTPEH